ncbi:MAG: DUF2785 domain-containing protein [Chloroflexi bacterium]|nr:MAG: DUF2785 domain-containing protein [Chloroflexota bacterium]
MDKDFWASIARNDYKIPGGYTPKELTKILFDYLSSTDPELRDETAYIVYANWLEQEMYTKEEVSAHVKELLPNLAKGIGDTESDSVFLRAFSVLFLAEIVHNDNKKPLLEKDQIQSILAKGLWYLNAEKDPRGHVPVKGWAHALAHTADLMLVLGCNRNLAEKNLQEILDAISTKMVHTTSYLYIHGEDVRLARAVMEVLRRNLISLEKIELWANSFIQPDGKGWKDAYVHEDRNRAFQNTRNLLRSIYLELVAPEEEISNQEPLQGIFFNALKNLKSY